MIKIKILVEQDFVTSYISQGHALNWVDRVHQANQTNLELNTVSICSAVSMLEYNFLYSVKALIDAQLMKAKIKEGSFNLDLVKKMSHFEQPAFNEKRVMLKALSQSLLIGLSVLKKKYPEQINLMITKQ